MLTYPTSRRFAVANSSYLEQKTERFLENFDRDLVAAYHRQELEQRREQLVERLFRERAAPRVANRPARPAVTPVPRRIVETEALVINAEWFRRQDELHKLACEILAHMAAHGDVSLGAKLVDKVTTSANTHFLKLRAEALKGWFFQMSGKQIIKRQGVWALKRGWNREAFRLTEARTTPIN
jgi:hypothetical protein